MQATSPAHTAARHHTGWQWLQCLQTAASHCLSRIDTCKYHWCICLTLQTWALNSAAAVSSKVWLQEQPSQISRVHLRVQPCHRSKGAPAGAADLGQECLRQPDLLRDPGKRQQTLTHLQMVCSADSVKADSPERSFFSTSISWLVVNSISK